ncbi:MULTISPECIES: hypothetical protein [unclassified Sinorhizobium]|uniref:hypothetical protein n=1 Tax=unclassified Sinorhizobium TaxID=2613772 RepID=UPI0035264022
MVNLTDELSEQDWSDARTWIDRLKADPDNEGLLVEFEEWLGEIPSRAGAYRKILDTLEALPLLKEHSKHQSGDRWPGAGPGSEGG